jgi:hypothetical protein
MSEEIDLYFFDPTPEAAKRLTTLERLFNDERWAILQWPDAMAQPHFNMRVRFIDSGSIGAPLSPPMTYLVSVLSMQPTSDAAVAAVGTILTAIAPHVRDGTIPNLSLTLADRRRIRIEAGEVPSITVSDNVGRFDEYVAPLDATERDIAKLQLIQQLEHSSDVRIKFASLDDKSRYIGDAREEYGSFLTELPQGWRQEGRHIDVQTRSESKRRAWHLRSKDQIDVAVVEHETGVEFLLISLAVGVATNAVYDLAKWGLKKWLDKRQGSSKLPTFLEVERVRKAADGTTLGSERIRVRAPVADDQLRSIVEQYMRATPENY